MTFSSRRPRRMFHVHTRTALSCAGMAIREVARGEYLGLAYLTMRDGEHLGCFFGVAKS